MPRCLLIGIQRVLKSAIITTMSCTSTPRQESLTKRSTKNGIMSTMPKKRKMVKTFHPPIMSKIMLKIQFGIWKHISIIVSNTGFKTTKPFQNLNTWHQQSKLSKLNLKQHILLCKLINNFVTKMTHINVGKMLKYPILPIWKLSSTTGALQLRQWWKTSTSLLHRQIIATMTSTMTNAITLIKTNGTEP